MSAEAKLTESDDLNNIRLLKIIKLEWESGICLGLSEYEAR